MCSDHPEAKEDDPHCMKLCSQADPDTSSAFLGTYWVPNRVVTKDEDGYAILGKCILRRVRALIET